MIARCGDCNHFRILNRDSGVGACMVNKNISVLDITPKGKREGCKFEDKGNLNTLLERTLIC